MTATLKFVFSSKMMRYPESLHDNTVQPCVTRCLCNKHLKVQCLGKAFQQKNPTGFQMLAPPYSDSFPWVCFFSFLKLQIKKEFYIVFLIYHCLLFSIKKTCIEMLNDMENWHIFSLVKVLKTCGLIDFCVCRRTVLVVSHCNSGQKCQTSKHLFSTVYAI